MRSLLAVPLLVLPLCVLHVTPLGLLAQDATAKSADEQAAEEFDARIEVARQKGIDYLVENQQEDGSWIYEKHELGITALCTLALVESGLSPTNEIVKKGVAYVREHARGTTNTYDIALSIVLLSKIGSKRDEDTIKGLAASLLAGQLTSGGWTYSCPKGSKEMLLNPRGWPKRKTSPGDNSCTQFAVLGLWVASRDDVEIENAMAGVARRFVHYQNPDGGWAYGLPAEPDEPAAPGQPAARGAKLEPSKDSMTFAGLFCLTVARATRIRHERDLERRGRTVRTTEPEPAEVVAGEEGDVPFEDAGSEAQTLEEDPIFKKGLEKAGVYAGGIRAGSAMYFMWSVERIGVMLGMEEIGQAEWFPKAAGAMLATQRPDGSWAGGHSEFANTSFAILVLRKANLGSDITRLLEGEPAQPFGIVGEEDRYDTLAEALAAADEGAVVRVEGDGPFVMPHLVIDKDLTLQAGFGYEPVFEYEVGSDEFGVRIRPERAPESRNMIRVTAGTLTLEGLKLEMDPPFSTRKDLDWAAVVADGGNLRLLNCNVTEQIKRGVVAVKLAQPGTHVLRNCALATSTSAVFVRGAGVQNVTLDNCLVYSDVALDLRQDTSFKGESSANITVENSTVQAREAVRLMTLDTFPLTMTLNGNAVQAETLLSTLAPVGRNTPRTFAGDGNLYDARTWVTLKGKSVSTVRDLSGWKRIHAAEEADSADRIAAFGVRRPLASYSHRLRPEDWELADGRLTSGIYPQTVGTNDGFERFRSTIQYNRWQKGEDAVVAAQ